MIVEALGLERAEVAAVLDSLERRGKTVATAESLTSGMVCAALTDVAGASAVVRGGLVVYATDMKATLAGVDPALLRRVGAVHPEVARQLAVGARERCAADVGVGLTGVAGPSPQDGVAPGTVHVGLASSREVRVRSVVLEGDRHEVRAGAVRLALAELPVGLD
ncbi:nicotinamide-nucleotide amidohydrolase family protein [Allosaccharopolyspora coralli]|uniref:Nicotinamide-nucleotide amidohydrolase family protein n=1 Tax=Allosaccharopolyspora coralli TaxID=2665642 RepID=A0A5Q3QJA2_9PSEU|nr:CinA family protein [Allosaccharopolyspora coralli]QGK70917.1 nicotinamide-nucleotide amidohydrolase family protein [Allosaccharopolyspora coralli]